MKLSLSFILLFISLSSIAEVYTDITLRPCDPLIAERWKYTPTPVTALGTPKMPFHCEGDVKVFEITAEVVKSTFDESYEPGPIYTWGYNGSNPGPVIEILQGEKIKVIFKNNLPEPTMLHWHGLEVPFNQDGAEGHSQLPVKPGETFVYEWQITHQSGTFMYHAGQSLAKQLSMGLVGFLIIHPEKTPETLVDHDFLYFLQMWALPPHSVIPDVMEMMMFNYFTFNGKSSPYTPSPLVYVGEKTRIRFANMSMMEHPVHIHGHTWRVVATGGGDNPRSAHTYGNTILVPTAQTMDVIIDESTIPGEWMFHCHLPHHVTNNMDIDIIPGEPMYMANGGMHVVFRVFKGPNEPGYVNPNETEPGGTGGGHGGGHGGSHGGMPAPKITTYDGYIKLNDGKRIDVSLELFKAQEEKEWRKLKAYLKVYLNKDEFIVHEYDQVKYNFETGMINLDSDDKSVTLANLTYMDHGDIGMLSGEASVDFGSTRGEINLETRDEELADIKLKSDFSISGEYEGLCGDKKKNLQINSVRAFNNGSIDNNNPLANFIFAGVVGVNDGSSIKVDSGIKEGYYDPFKQFLSLKLDTNGAVTSLNCTPTFRANKVTGLDCSNSCKFQKKASNALTADPIQEAAAFKPDSTKVLSELDDSATLHGNYNGLLQLKNGSQIPLSLKVVAKRYATNSMVITKNHISGVVELVLPQNKKLTYKIKERQFLDSASVVNQNKNVLLLETHSKLELVVSRWSEAAVSGDVYHHDYGYLGAFQANKNNTNFLSVLQDPAQANLNKGIDGIFQNKDWSLSLESSELEQEANSSVYSPLHVKGSLKASDGSLTINIVDGTFDFAVNVIYLKTEDGRILKGQARQGEIELILPSRPVRRSKYLEQESSKLKLTRN